MAWPLWSTKSPVATIPCPVSYRTRQNSRNDGLALVPAGGFHFDGLPTYLANRDARARLTETESVNYGRVHRLDQISHFKPAKLFD